MLLFVVTPLRVVVASNSEADNIPLSKDYNSSTELSIVEVPKNTYSDLIFYYFQIKHPSSLDYTFPQIVPQQQTSLDKE